MEKLLLEACLEAMQTGAIVGIQDMGAAGLTCSTCEMGARGGVGLDVELDLVPQRETGMTAYEIMLSESQERMLLVAVRAAKTKCCASLQSGGLMRSSLARLSRSRGCASAITVNWWPTFPTSRSLTMLRSIIVPSAHGNAHFHSILRKRYSPSCRAIVITTPI